MRKINFFLTGAFAVFIACLIAISCSKWEDGDFTSQPTLKASSTIVVRARGVSGSEHISVTVAGTQVGSWTLTTSYANYSCTTGSDGVINVNYDNDASGRDVQVDYITVNGSTRQAEVQTTNTGSWNGSSCGGVASEWLYCNGYISFGNVGGGSSSSSSSSSSGGSNNFVVRARGTNGSEQIRLVVGSTTVSTWTLTTSYANYSASTNASGNARVQFINDASGLDVQVDYITVNGTTYQAENQSANTGVWQNSQCGGANSEWLHCNGYIEFTNSGSSSSSSSSSSSGGGCGGYVYLCFDDGPTSNTATLVNILKNAGARATFFVWGNRISGNMSGFNAIKNAGFSIQNHSYTHSHMTSWSYQQVYNDLQQCQQAIQSAGGGTPTKFRPPYLETNATIQSACSALGLTIVQPNVDTQDWNGASTSAIVSACNNLQNGGNPLMHDGYSTTNAAIPQIVQNLNNRGLCTTQY